MNNKLPELISEARKKLDISQRELSRRTGVDNAEISRIESGLRRQPDFFSLRSLAKELNIDFKVLVDAADYSEVDVEYLLPLEQKELTMATLDLLTKEDFYSVKTKDGIRKFNLRKMLRGFKEGNLTEDEFVEYLSKALYVDE